MIQKQSPTTSRLIPSQSLSNSHLGQTPPSSLTEHIIWLGTSPQSVWVSCPSRGLLQALAHPQPTCYGGRAGNRESGLSTVQALLSNSWSIHVFPMLFWPPASSTAPYRLLSRKLTPSQLDQVMSGIAPWFLAHLSKCILQAFLDMKDLLMLAVKSISLYNSFFAMKLFAY